MFTYKFKVDEELEQLYKKTFPKFHPASIAQNFAAPMSRMQIEIEELAEENKRDPNNTVRNSLPSFDISFEEFLENWRKENEIPFIKQRKLDNWSTPVRSNYIRMVKVPHVEYDGGDTIKIKVDGVLEKGYFYRFNTFIHMIMTNYCIVLVTPDTLPAPIYAIDSDDISSVMVYAIGNGEYVDTLTFKLRFYSAIVPKALHKHAIVNDTPSINPIKLSGMKHKHKTCFKIMENPATLRNGEETEEFYRGLKTNKEMTYPILVVPRKRNNPAFIFATPGVITKNKVYKGFRSTPTNVNVPIFNYVGVGYELICPVKLEEITVCDRLVSKLGFNSHFDIMTTYTTTLSKIKGVRRELVTERKKGEKGAKKIKLSVDEKKAKREKLQEVVLQKADLSNIYKPIVGDEYDGVQETFQCLAEIVKTEEEEKKEEKDDYDE